MDGNTFRRVPDPLFYLVALFKDSFRHTSQTILILLADSSCLRMNGWNTITTYSPNARAQLLFSSLNLLFGDALVAVVVVVC